MIQISKWWCLCLVAMLALTTTAFAQEDKTDDDEPVVVYDPDDSSTNQFSTSKMVIGVNGTFPTWNQNVFAIEFSPFAGYRLTDNWIVGAGINFKPLYINSPNVNSVDRFRANYLGGRVLTRYLLFPIADPGGVYAQAEFQVNRLKSTINGEVDEAYNVDPKSSALLGLGYTANYFSGFGYTVEVFYDFLHEDNLIPAPIGDLYESWPFSLRFGFTYGF